MHKTKPQRQEGAHAGALKRSDGRVTGAHKAGSGDRETAHQGKSRAFPNGRHRRAGVEQQGTVSGRSENALSVLQGIQWRGAVGSHVSEG